MADTTRPFGALNAFAIRLSPVLAAVLIVIAFAAPSAHAVVQGAVTLDGPSEEIVGFGGVAMAEDGSGGVVYLKRVNGVAHVFVSRYLSGHWLAPVRIDREEQYAASVPRIGAANGGELVVIWATPFASENERPVEELLSSTLGPGAETFGPAIIVDRDIRQGGAATSPDLAMSSTGQADVVYRVVMETEGKVNSIPLLHPGDVDEQVRVAHFNGERWTTLGAINRNVGLSMRPPTESNAPQIAIGPTGNAIVVWQEPDVEGVARIWARRLFGSTVDYVMPASATSVNGVGVTADADAPTVALSKLGQAEVAYRQSAGPGSPLAGPRIFINTLPDGESASGSEFVGAKVADSSVSGGSGAQVGRPSIDVDEKQDVRLFYDSNGTPRVVQGTDLGLTGTLSLGSPFVGSRLTAASELPTASVMNPAGGGLSAWPSADPSGNPAVAVREDFPTGAVQTALLTGAAGGPVGDLAVGRSGLGDGIVAFQQGAVGDASIVAAQVSAPPASFVTAVPRTWLKPSQATIAWEPAPSANAPVSYTIVLDGRVVSAAQERLTYTFDPHGLGDGVHHVQILATDSFGQALLTPSAPLKISGRPPRVRISSAGTAVIVRVTDPYSGVETRRVSITFGDGGRGSARTVFRHRYAHPGVYLVLVHVTDRVGNSGVVRKLVNVR
jgi:hypothetical protein